MPPTNGFRFVNSFSGNGIKQNKDTRRDVRSYVARVSHNPNGAKGNTTRLKGDKHRSTVVFDVEITSFQDEDDAPPAPPKRKSPPKLPSPPPNEDDFNQPQSQSHPPTQPGPPPPYHLARRISPIHILSTHTATPLASLPVYHKPFMPAVMHNYVTKLALPIPELDDNSPHPVLRTVWLPMVMHDPAIFQVIVLFAAAHYATYAEPERWQTFYTEILSLKQNALRALLLGMQASSANSNGGASSREGPSPGSHRGVLSSGDEECLIAAIAKMASYEAIYGDAAAYHTHMSACARLLSARGGLPSLGMNGILARLLRFVDTNSAFLLGTHLYLTGNEGVGVCLPRHMPFRLRRFEEHASGAADLGSTGPADVPVGLPGPGEMRAGSEETRRREVAGLGVVNVERFVGL